MDVPPEIAFRNVEPTDRLKQKVLEGIDKLERVYPEIASCRVMVERRNARQGGRGQPHVRLDISIPRNEFAVTRDGEPSNGDDVVPAIKEAFAVARRRLKELKDKQANRVKHHDLPPHGRVVRLLADETGVRYGFLMSREGREIYFHENALVDLDWEELEVGTEVRFAEGRGDEGPQASTVAPLDSQKIGPRNEEEVPLKEGHGRKE